MGAADIRICGIRNCDTMKKAFDWLEKKKISYEFQDYKKNPPDAVLLRQAIAAHGWQQIINRKGTSWRQLPEKVREGMTEKTAMAAALENPSLIKRPLVFYRGGILLGFDEKTYAAALGGK